MIHMHSDPEGGPLWHASLKTEEKSEQIQKPWHQLGRDEVVNLLAVSR